MYIIYIYKLQIVIISCIFNLVATPYFLLIQLLEETSSSTPQLLLRFLWIILHFIRLLLIVHPCHSTLQKVRHLI